jgi:hypothetical protein
MTTETFTQPLPYTCLVCHQPCEEVYVDSGLCLACDVDWQNTTVLEYEAEEEAKFQAPDIYDLADELYHAQF